MTKSKKICLNEKFNEKGEFIRDVASKEPKEPKKDESPEERERRRLERMARTGIRPAMTYAQRQEVSANKTPEQIRKEAERRKKLAQSILNQQEQSYNPKVKTFREFIEISDYILEENRRAQRASKAGRVPKEGPKSKQNKGPSAVVTVGLPGSGKSTIAKHMVSKGNTDQHELDKSRQALGKGPAHFGPDIVKHTYDGAKKSAQQGRNTVLSNTSIPKQHRQDAVNKLKDSGYKDVKAVLSPGSTKAAMRRNRKRTGTKPGEGAVPQFVMNRMKQGMNQMSRSDRRELRSNYKELHKQERFTKPAMKRSGAIKSRVSEEYEMIANYLYNEGFIIDSIEELDEIIESMSDELKNEILEIVEAKEAKPPQEVLNKISKAYSRKHRGVNVSASHRKSGDIRLDDIWIPPSERNKGIGSRAMKGLTKYADKQGKRITLNQSPEPGKKEKLKQFYQKHGFKPNTGRSRDLSVSDTHIRNPQKSESFSYSSPKYQEKLMKDREKKKKRQETERQQRNSELYRQRKTKGIRAYSKGQSGWIIDGKFTPDS